MRAALCATRSCMYAYIVRTVLCVVVYRRIRISRSFSRFVPLLFRLALCILGLSFSIEIYTQSVSVYTREK